MVSEHISCMTIVVVSEHVSCVAAVVVVSEHIICMTTVVVVSEHVSCMAAVVVSEHVSCMAAVSEVFTSWFSSHMVSEHVSCLFPHGEWTRQLSLPTWWVNTSAVWLLLVKFSQLLLCTPHFFVSALMETVFLPFLLLMNVWTRNVCFFFLFFSFVLLNALLSCPFWVLCKVVKGGWY